MGQFKFNTDEKRRAEIREEMREEVNKRAKQMQEDGACVAGSHLLASRDLQIDELVKLKERVEILERRALISLL